MMRTKRQLNSGSALIVVIVCTLVVGVIASVVLSIAGSNLRNMTVSRRSTDNFYSAENAVDELKSRLQASADISVRKAYKDWLQQYSYLSHAEQQEKFKSLFLDDFYARLKSEVYSSYTEDTYKPDGTIDIVGTKTPKGVADLLGNDFTAANVVWSADPVLTRNADNVTLSISVKYTEDDGTVSTISTDLVFKLENPDFQINTAAGVNVTAADYAIIADDSITNNSVAETRALQGSVNITGSIYGGGDNTGIGIDFMNDPTTGHAQHISLKSKQILSRNSIRISNGGWVVAEGENEFGESPTEIWARNILLTNVGNNNNAPGMQMTGDCYLADDLTLNAKNSYFEMGGVSSKFVGYGASETDVSNSSAIIVNGLGSQLFMNEPNPIYGGKISISGKSFISVPVKFGFSDVAGTLLQGESIAYKGEQAAYLLPGECVIGIGHNPMTKAEFEKLSNGSDNVHYSLTEAEADHKSCYVNIDKSAVNGGIDLGAYVQVSRAVKVMHVNYDNSTQMVYLYLNFRDSNSATDYFKQYAEFYGELVNDRIQTLGGTIQINTLALETTGNVMATNEADSFVGANKRSSDSSMIMNQWELTTKFNGLINNLTKDYIGLGTQTYLTDNIVNMSKAENRNVTIDSHGHMMSGASEVIPTKIVVSLADGTVKDTFTRRAGVSNSYWLYTGKNVTLSAGVNTAGIIIASGDVTINAGAQFTGLIIARGKVIFKGNVTVKSDPENVLYIMQNCPEVRDYFEITNVTAGTGSGGEILASDLINITYENWKKN